MQEQVLRTIEEHQLIHPMEKVLVAVSGGPDSIALLHWLWSNASRWNIQIACAHFNHGFRGEESDEDEKFVSQYAQHLGIPFFSRKEPLGTQIEKGGVNLQVLARERRYAFLIDVAHQIGAAKIAFAHHADDQVETFLMRLLRGTGPSGLIGIPYTRRLSDFVTGVRPFLDISKKNILAYMKLHNLRSRIDSSNLKLYYTRNRIRLEAIPYLNQFNPELSSSILSLTRMLKEDESYLSREASFIFDQIVIERKENEISIDLSIWRTVALSLQRRVIKLILNYLTKNEEELSYLHMEAIRSLFQRESPGKWNLPYGLEVVAHYGKGVFREKRDQQVKMEFLYPVHIPGRIELKETGDVFQFTVTTDRSKQETKSLVYFDYEKLQEPLVIRNRKAGDRMWIKGLDGHKKVKDIFIEEKIPKEFREQIPLLFSGNELLWIPGYRKSSKSTYDQATKRFLCCEYIAAQEKLSST